jgi:pimeloyl-ACP methyl ester carboxylesterase
MNFNNTLVILIHGFCRSSKNMQYWKRQLLDTFPNIITPNLPTTYCSMADCVALLAKEIEQANPSKYEAIYIAGHSMGGLIARDYLIKHPLNNVEKLLCVGTPHYGSKLANIALLCPFTGRIWKPLHDLKTSARTVVNPLSIPKLKIGTIVSSNNAHWPGKLFFSNPADGLVECFSAHAPDEDVTTTTLAPHDPMQYDKETANLIKKFFTTGSF